VRAIVLLLILFPSPPLSDLQLNTPLEGTHFLGAQEYIERPCVLCLFVFSATSFFCI
jgi:hypothetical protein